MQSGSSLVVQTSSSTGRNLHSAMISRIIVNAFCLLCNVDIPALLLGHLLALLRQPRVEPGHLTDSLARQSLHCTLHRVGGIHIKFVIYTRLLNSVRCGALLPLGPELAAGGRGEEQQQQRRQGQHGAAGRGHRLPHCHTVCWSHEWSHGKTLPSVYRHYCLVPRYFAPQNTTAEN